MKKNYNCPETEEVLLEGCVIMQTDGASTVTPMEEPTSGGWKSPRKL